MAPPPRKTDTRQSLAEQNRSAEDRREGVRVDDRVLLEYWLVGDKIDAGDNLHRFAQIPLFGFQEEAEGHKLHPLIVQWMSKIEWTLDAILRVLEHQAPKRVSTPRLMDVSISGDGVRFLPYRPLTVGDRIELRMVLPPFIVVEAKGEVTQVRPDSSGPDPAHTVIVQFVDIADTDREKIVRYVVQRQADLLRRRQRAGR